MKTVLILAAVAAVLALFCIPCAADELIDEEYGRFTDALPDSLASRLPDGVGEDVSSDAAALTDWSYISDYLASVLDPGFRKAMRILASLMGLILISSAISSLCTSLGGGVSHILSVCSGAAVCAAAVSLQYDVLLGVATYLADLSALMNAMLPLTVSLYALGGNVAAAGVSGSAFGVFLNVCENLLGTTVIPFAGACIAFALLSSVPSGLDMRGVIGAVKKTYATALSFVMMLFSVLLGAQSALAAASDSVSLRAAKFVAGSVIPVLGGSVGESVRVLASGMGVLRKSMGVFGIMLIVLLFLPVLVSLLLMRASNGIAASFAGLLGCDREKAVLSELSSVYGYVIGVVAMCSVSFIFALTLLVGTGVAGQ